MIKKARRLRGAALWVGAILAFVLITVLPTIPWLTTFGEVILLPAGFWLGVLFSIYYTLLARWWHTPMGRMVISFDLAFVLIAMGDTLHVEFGLTFGDGWSTRIVLAGLLIAPVVIASRIILLGQLNGWKPVLPWRHQGDDALMSTGTSESPEAPAVAPTAEPG